MDEPDSYSRFLAKVREVAKGRDVAIRVEMPDGASPRPALVVEWSGLPTPWAETSHDDAGVNQAIRREWRCAAWLDTFKDWWPPKALRTWNPNRSEDEPVVSVYELPPGALRLPKQAMLNTKAAPVLLRLPVSFVAA